MFDYARKVKLALGDTARRTAMKIVAGFVILIGAGFLLAALWSFLAHDLGWGSTLASLAIGLVLVIIALILVAMGSRRQHEMPTTDELKREVEARVTMATEAAAAKARHEAMRVVDMAENRAHALMDQASYRAGKLANDAERKVLGTIRDKARSVGLTSENLSAARRSADQSRQQFRQAANSNGGSMSKLFGAFAVGITLAAALQERRRQDEDYDPHDLM
ncbi:MAG: phage holin family protein [Alphaproteobacteria bacterium]|nr:phage holin family protein [Alphaproteobacteria bacterium]